MIVRVLPNAEEWEDVPAAAIAGALGVEEGGVMAVLGRSCMEVILGDMPSVGNSDDVADEIPSPDDEVGWEGSLAAADVADVELMLGVEGIDDCAVSDVVTGRGGVGLRAEVVVDDNGVEDVLSSCLSCNSVKVEEANRAVAYVYTM